MKSLKYFFLCAVLFSFTLVSCSDDEDRTPKPISTPATSEEVLDDYLQSVIDETDMPGFTLTVVNHGEVAYQNSFGYADVASKKPYTNQTTQPIGSVSKTFIGAAIVKAIEDGYFTLETDINDILPIELVNPKNPDAIIRVKHLVSHTSGLLDDDEAYWGAYYILLGENMDSEGARLMADLVNIQQREALPLGDFLAEYYLEDGDFYSENNFSDVEPGTEWNYSNIASSLAAFLIEAATGQSYAEYVSENIFQPLGMNNSAFHVDGLNADNMATLYFDINTPLPLYGNDSYPDGSLMTSNEDLTKYLLDMMKGVSGNSETLFSKAGYDMLFAPVSDSPLAEAQAIFWNVGGGSVSHDGGDPGTSTFMQFSEDGQVGFLLLTTMDGTTDENEEAFVEVVIPMFDAISEFISNN